jgi:hypothetical protein
MSEMISATIEELKYKLADIFVKQGASPTTVVLFEQFVNQIDAALRQQGKPVFFRTHTYGVTGFCTERKGFVFINLRQDYISTLYWTGRASIPGLGKANWLNKGDNKGSETFRIADNAAVKKAVEFACAAYDIAVNS